MHLFLRSLFRLSRRKTDARRSPPRAARRRPAVEALEDRTLLSITVPTPGTPGPVTLTGTAQDDQFVIRLQAGTPANIQFSDDGGSTFTTAALGDVTGVSVSGLDGRDTLTVDNGNGLVGKAGGLALSFDGGAGRNTLVVRGGTTNPGLRETYTVGTTPDAGTLTSDNGTASQTLSFTSLADVVDTTPADSLTVNFDNRPNVVRLRNADTVGGVVANRIQGIDRHDEDDDAADANLDDAREQEQAGRSSGGDSGGGQQQGGGDNGGDNHGGNPGGDDNGGGHHNGDNHGGDGDNGGTSGDNGGSGGNGRDGGDERDSFVPITFANKTAVTVNTLGGDDRIEVDNTVPAAGLTSLTIDGGDGTDRADARTLPASVNVTFLNIEQINRDANEDLLVRELYESRLKRDPGNAEVAFWTQALQQTGSRDAVAAGIEHSPEGRDRLVRSWYENYLGREAVNNEEAGWVNALVRGATEEAVIGGIVGSGEFQDRANGLATSGTAAEKYVKALYSFLLQRTATDGEVAGWVNALGVAGSRGVAAAFLQSREFRKDVVTALYAGLLHRNPDDRGLDSWVSSDLDLTRIRLGFEASAEYATNG